MFEKKNTRLFAFPGKKQENAAYNNFIVRLREIPWRDNFFCPANVINCR